jgi:hypothetical protein
MVPRTSATDFTTEITETDRMERRVRIRIRNPFLPASVASVLSVVRSGSFLRKPLASRPQ